MTTASYTDVRANFTSFLDKADSDREVCVITRSKWRKSVLMSYKDYSWLLETAYLMSTKANRDHLEDSIKELDSWKIVKMSL